MHKKGAETLLRADLHLHTQASDGTWTPKEAVLAAKSVGLGIMAVTDHENTGSVLQTRAIAQEEGLKFLTGVEISSTKGEQSFHILGYGIDPKNKELLELLEHNSELLEKKDEDSIEILAKKGWPISLAEYHDYVFDRSRGGWKALSYLIDKKLCTGVGDFFARIFVKENKLGFPVFPEIKEVINVIHKAGGAAFLAHSASDFHGPGLDETLKALGQEKFDGFECYHTSHNQEDTATLVRYCHEHGKLISGGSDAHGNFTPHRKIGFPEIYQDDINLGGLL